MSKEQTVKHSFNIETAQENTDFSTSAWKEKAEQVKQEITRLFDTPDKKSFVNATPKDNNYIPLKIELEISPQTTEAIFDILNQQPAIVIESRQEISNEEPRSSAISHGSPISQPSSSSSASSSAATESASATASIAKTARI